MSLRHMRYTSPVSGRQGAEEQADRCKRKTEISKSRSRHRGNISITDETVKMPSYSVNQKLLHLGPCG